MKFHLAAVFFTSNIINAVLSLEWEPRSSYDTTPNQLLGRHHPIVFANETHGFLLGGTTRDTAAAADFYIYEEATDTWTDHTLDALPFPPRSFGYGVVLNQANHPKAYLGFGANLEGERLNDLWEFDMRTLEFRQLASLPGFGRRHPSMVPVFVQDDNKWQIHVGLGDGYDGTVFTNFNDYWMYDIETDQWSQLPDFPSSRRHHPFFFGMGDTSFTGLGHSDGTSPYIERDFYSYSATRGWIQEPDFESYAMDDESLQTTEARVAGTEFSIELPIRGADPAASNLVGSIGFVLSGDGDDHKSMAEGEFHAFYPEGSDLSPSTMRWRQLTPHPGGSRWAPGSFVIRGTARAYFTSGFDRSTNQLPSDVWKVDLSSLFGVLSNAVEEPQPEDGTPDSIFEPPETPVLSEESEGSEPATDSQSTPVVGSDPVSVSGSESSAKQSILHSSVTGTFAIATGLWLLWN